jgi:hypothetical protein
MLGAILGVQDAVRDGELRGRLIGRRAQHVAARRPDVDVIAEEPAEPVILRGVDR